MNYIKKIFENKVDETVRQKLVRYGKGEYETGLMEITKTGKNIKVKASFDLSNDLFGTIAESINKEAEVSGSLIAARDFEKEFIFLTNYKKKKGANCGEINGRLKPEQMRGISDNFKSNFILLDVKSDGFSLTVGKKLPKPGGAIKGNFCRATLPVELLNDFIWEAKDFKKAILRHLFIINELIVPKEYENDYANARIVAKRKGKIKRIIEFDGKKIEKEIEFIA